MTEPVDSRLLQEILIERDPTGWQMLVGCQLLNQTGRVQVDRVWPELFERWPTPARFMAGARQHNLYSLLRPLGLQNRRARLLMRFTDWWTRSSEMPGLGERIVLMEPPGIGEYARDSWIIFAEGPTTDNVQRLLRYNDWPQDKELRKWMLPVIHHVDMIGRSDPYAVQHAWEAWRWQIDHPGGVITESELRSMVEYSIEASRENA